jgi:hypothetical protein
MHKYYKAKHVKVETGELNFAKKIFIGDTWFTAAV